MTQNRKVAMVLAGCGAKDGSEITEAVSLLISLVQKNFQVSMFAPDRPTHHTINHLTSREDGSPRNILAEAARIARGKVRPLNELREEEFAAIAFPGGFGSMKNLCNYALAGRDATLAEDVKKALLPFLKANKPACALCIAPVILALGGRELGWKDMHLTLGDDTSSDVVKDVTAWGCVHEAKQVHQACIDRSHKLVSAPAYMHDSSSPADIFASAQALVEGLQQLLGS